MAKKSEETPEELTERLKTNMVKVRLPRQQDDPETLPVQINGSIWNVPLGEETEVPENVAIVLQHAGYFKSY